MSVSFSGPLFDGRAKRALREGSAAARHAVSREGERLTRAAFSSAIRHDTGRFLGSITSTDHSTVYTSGGSRGSYSLPVVADGIDETVVTTDLATYGPWLEGTGSRNESTRFKGYHGFRIAAQELEGSAQRIADEGFAPYADRMN